MMLTQKKPSAHLLTKVSRRAQRGMTLVETMLVLMIGVLVIAGVVVLARVISENMKVNRSKEFLQQMGSGIQQMFGGNGATPYAGLSGGLARLSFIPADLIENDVVYLPVGDGRTVTVDVVAAEGGIYFDIIVSGRGTPITNCADLVMTNFGPYSLYDVTNHRPASGDDGAVGKVGDSVRGNVDGSAMSASAVQMCSNTTTSIIWHHL
jgi:type II secretory pathway pseudopilin PulG